MGTQFLIRYPFLYSHTKPNNTSIHTHYYLLYLVGHLLSEPIDFPSSVAVDDRLPGNGWMDVSHQHSRIYAYIYCTYLSDGEGGI